MELGLALDLLMCNYSSALAYSTLCLLLFHALRASRPQSTRRFRLARGCSARQRATAKPCTAVLDLVVVACSRAVPAVRRASYTRLGVAPGSEWILHGCDPGCDFRLQIFSDVILGVIL